MNLDQYQPIEWIVVVGGREAKAYVRRQQEKIMPIIGNAPERKRLTQVKELVPVTHWQSEAYDRSDEGRYNGTAPQSIEPDHLARAIASGLNAAREKREFDSLTLVAQSPMLGRLKSLLDPKALHALRTALPKDFSHYSRPELLRQLERSHAA